MTRRCDDAYFGLDGMDESWIKAERDKARRLRKSRWWQRKTAPGRCHYCGRRVGQAALTMDHLVPLSRGGRSTKDNLVPCCKRCNTEKRARLSVEWQEYLDRLDEKSA